MKERFIKQRGRERERARTQNVQLTMFLLVSRVAKVTALVGKEHGAQQGRRKKKERKSKSTHEK